MFISNLKMIRTNLVVGLVFVLLLFSIVLAEEDPVDGNPIDEPGTVIEPSTIKKTFEERANWWLYGKFGMFIHWGPYSTLGGVYEGRQTPGEAEWIMKGCRIPVAEYEQKVARKWNPVNYNPRQWAQLAKEAGMKYMVMTTKHHDGFALFHSEVSDYNAVDFLPTKRDLLKEYLEACRTEGLKAGVYYSHGWDWHYGAGNSWDSAVKGIDLDKYIDEKAVPQVTELLTKYGKIDILWWDMPDGVITKAHKDRATKLVELYRFQPEMIVNKRMGAGYSGDFDTHEQHVPRIPSGKRPWETCMTMNGTWGYAEVGDRGTAWKSINDLVFKLCDINSKGGNFLLNVGPKGDGTFPQKAIDRLKAIGAWLKRNNNGETIYGTTHVFREMPFWGRMTGRDNLVFVHIFDWPENNKLLVPGVGGKVKNAYMLKNKDIIVKTSSVRDGTELELSLGSDDDIASIVVLDMESKPEIWEIFERADAQGNITLLPHQADINHWRMAKPENSRKPIAIAGWRKKNHFAEWPVDIPEPGKYEIIASCAVPPTSSGSVCEIKFGPEVITNRMASTGGKDTYKDVRFGIIHIKKIGKQRLKIRHKSVTDSRWGMMSLQKIVLRRL